MSMPYIDDDLEDDAAESTLEDFEIEGSDLVFDFDSGDISVSDGDADTIDGEEALKQWIEKVFNTRAGIYEIYEAPEDSDDEDDEYDDEMDAAYGTRLREIMMEDSPDSLKLASVQQEIEDALGMHPDILDVSDFEFSRSKRDLTVTFTVLSSYGESEEEVTIDVTNSQ